MGVLLGEVRGVADRAADFFGVAMLRFEGEDMVVVVVVTTVTLASSTEASRAAVERGGGESFLPHCIWIEQAYHLA